MSQGWLIGRGDKSALPLPAHVNLIPFNPVEGTPYRAPDRAAIRRFKQLVEAQGLNVTVRDTRGREADAACGQLHERVMRNKVAVS